MGSMKEAECFKSMTFLSLIAVDITYIECYGTVCSTLPSGYFNTQLIPAKCHKHRWDGGFASENGVYIQFICSNHVIILKSLQLQYLYDGYYVPNDFYVLSWSSPSLPTYWNREITCPLSVCTYIFFSVSHTWLYWHGVIQEMPVITKPFTCNELDDHNSAN